MNKHTKLPTFIGLAVVFLGLVAGVFLINSKQVFKLGAQVEFTPNNVRVTNLSPQSFTVSWLTEVPTKGFVKWGTNENSLTNVSSGELESDSYVHLVTITNLKPNTGVFFEINSGSYDFDNQHIPWTAKTSGGLSPTQITASGIILDKDVNTPALALVYVTIDGQVFSSVTSNNGNWVIPVSSNSQTSIAEITAFKNLNETAQAVILVNSLQQTPAIVIGKTYDFRGLNTNLDTSLPESSLTLPEQSLVSSRFETGDSVPHTNTVAIPTIDSVTEGEVITTENPEFFGRGPKNTEFEIIIESDPQAGTVTTNSKGLWNFSPPEGLTPGEHTITLRWRDTNGILKTLTRTFIVSAAEGPAFVATPSGTPIKTLTPAPTVAVTITPNISPTNTAIATAPPVPESGSLTPTIGLFIMGVGILLSSLYVGRNQNA